MPTCLLGLGSNLGDRRFLLEEAVRKLSMEVGVHDVVASEWMETQPVGGPAGQSPFLNGAVTLETSLSPRRLLTLTQGIEADLGRQRVVRWDARPIDIDLLLYGDLVVDEESLTIPHPWMGVRRFVVAPAAQIAGELIHPVFGWTMHQLSSHLQREGLRVALVDFVEGGQFVKGVQPHRSQSKAWRTLQELGGIQFGENWSALKGSEEGRSVEIDDADQAIQFVAEHATCFHEHRWTHADTENKICVSASWLPEIVSDAAAKLNDVEGLSGRLAKISEKVQTPDLLVLTTSHFEAPPPPTVCPWIRLPLAEAADDDEIAAWSKHVIAAITMMTQMDEPRT